PPTALPCADATLHQVSRASLQRPGSRQAYIPLALRSLACPRCLAYPSLPIRGRCIRRKRFPLLKRLSQFHERFGLAGALATVARRQARPPPTRTRHTLCPERRSASARRVAR